MEKILVSACLLGLNCKYNGNNNKNELVINYLKDKEIIPICPEIMGGLATPRIPAEIKNDKVLTKNGNDVTENYYKGAKEVLYIAKLLNVKLALLKTKSPSCGHKKIYDGTFSNTITDGDGITTKLLKKHGIKIITEEEIKGMMKNE